MHFKSQITKVKELDGVVLAQLKFLVLDSSGQTCIETNTESNLLCWLLIAGCSLDWKQIFTWPQLLRHTWKHTFNAAPDTSNWTLLVSLK